MDKYNKALIWLINSDYDIQPVLEKNIVRFDLIHKEKVIKSDKVPFTIHFVEVLHQKIINLYNHFNNGKDKILT